MAYNMCILFSKHLSTRRVNCNLLLHFCKHNLKVVQNFLHNEPAKILGIESSCDETGCGIVDSNGTVLGEALHSQHITHLNFGGIIPTVARTLHIDNITKVCENALKASNLKLKDIDAIATTVKPGLFMSLEVGTEFGKYLAKIGKKPFIPIHHMEAHALTARMTEKVDFPYLVLLVSGGHCMLAVVKSISKFYLLGTTLNKAPGDVFDKVARRLKLRNIPEFNALNGGPAIEIAANEASHIDQFLFPSVYLAKHYDCNFSFGGIMSYSMNVIEQEETKYNITGNAVIPDVYNFCAAFQLSVVKHICQRTQRAMEYINKMSLIPESKRTLVVSGGVACNNFLIKALSTVSEKLGYKVVRPPPKLCTDNGIMIAWNGVEKWVANTDVIRDFNEIEKIEAQPEVPFGENWIEKVQSANLKCKWIKIN